MPPRGRLRLSRKAAQRLPERSPTPPPCAGRAAHSSEATPRCSSPSPAPAAPVDRCDTPAPEESGASRPCSHAGSGESQPEPEWLNVKDAWEDEGECDLIDHLDSVYDQYGCNWKVYFPDQPRRSRRRRSRPDPCRENLPQRHSLTRKDAKQLIRRRRESGKQQAQRRWAAARAARRRCVGALLHECPEQGEFLSPQPPAGYIARSMAARPPPSGSTSAGIACCADAPRRVPASSPSSSGSLSSALSEEQCPWRTFVRRPWAAPLSPVRGQSCGMENLTRCPLPHLDEIICMRALCWGSPSAPGTSGNAAPTAGAANAAELTVVQQEEHSKRERAKRHEELERIRHCAAFWDVRSTTQEELAQRSAVVAKEARQRVCAVMALRHKFLGVLERERRGAIGLLQQRYFLQLQQACDFGCIWLAADAEAKRVLAARDALRVKLPRAIQKAALARLRAIRVSTPGAVPEASVCGTYLRSFEHTGGSPQWVMQKGAERYSICLERNGYSILTSQGHRCSRESPLPLSSRSVVWKLKAGLVKGVRRCSVVLSPVHPDAKAEQLPDFATGDLRAMQRVNELFHAVGPDSDLCMARSEAWALRVRLDHAQGTVCGSSEQDRAGAQRERDAVREEACRAQRRLTEALNSPAVELLLGEEAISELQALESRFREVAAAAGAGGGDDDGCRPAAKHAIAEAARKAGVLLHAHNQWQSAYADAVVEAEQSTDAALAAAQGFHLDGARPLRELAAAVERAAEAESVLRAQSDGVSTAPREEKDAAVAAAVTALDVGLGELMALRAERSEAQAVLAELAEGCEAAEGHSFYKRLDCLAAPSEAPTAASERRPSPELSQTRQQYDAMLSMKDRFPPEVWEAVCESLRAQLLQEAGGEEGAAHDTESTVLLADLREEADVLRMKLKNPKTPARKAELTERLTAVLQQLREAHRARTAEVVAVLQLARVHFPECIAKLCQGADEWLRGWIHERRPEALRLLLAGGSLSDYTLVSASLSSSKQVHRAEGCDGLVVIKKVPLTHNTPEDTQDALRSFGRGIIMMDAAGEAAVALRSAFIDVQEQTQYGCVVMENCAFGNLSDWLSADRAGSLSAAAILRMAQLLLGCLVRLHSVTPQLRDSRDPAGADCADGIVHGDVTPWNFVVDASGQPRFIDFELSTTGSVQSTVCGPRGMTVDFAAPELLGLHGTRDPRQKATKATDVFGLGATLRWMLTQPHVRAAAGSVCDHLLPLCERMTAKEPSARPSAGQAFADSDITEAINRQLLEGQRQLERQHRAECDRVNREQARVQAEQREVAKQAHRLQKKAKELLDQSASARAANSREQEKLERMEAKLRAQSASLAAKEKHLSDERGDVEAKKAEIEQLKEAIYDPPKYWTDAPMLKQGWRAVPIAEKTPVFDVLRDSLHMTKKAWLGYGRDAAGGWYNELELRRAWRIENPSLWKQFAIQRESIADAIKHKRLSKKEIRFQPQEASGMLEAKGVLPGALHTDGGVNEAWLFSAPNVDALLGICNDGMNERFSGTNAGVAFGHGVYAAADPGKADQYARPHHPGTRPDLERRLYRGGDAQPGSVCYVLLCRAVLGDFASTEDGSTLASSGGPLWATLERRELVRTTAGDHYTSLVVELGMTILRYREFVLFRGQRIYPEYLLAYQRV